MEGERDIFTDVVFTTLLALMAAIFFMLAWRSAGSYSRIAELETQGQITSARVVERIRKETGGRPPRVDFYIRYQFRNTSVPDGIDCPFDMKFLTTPRGARCSNPTHLWQIDEKEFREFNVDDVVRIRYLTNPDQTISAPIGLGVNSRNARLQLLFFSTLGLGTAWLLWRYITRRRFRSNSKNTGS